MAKIRKLYLGKTDGSSASGSYLDLGLSSVGASLTDTTFKVTGSSENDTIFLRPSGYSFEFLDSDGKDKIYLTGKFSDYTSTVEDGVLKLTRGSGDTAESISLSATSASTLVFADGFNTAVTISSRISDSQTVALDTSETSVEPQNLTASASAETITDTAGNNESQSFVGGANMATLTVIGNGKVDHVYVGQGGAVDATLLGSGQDVIYLEGKWEDYAKAVSGLQVTLTRTVKDVFSGQEIDESVVVSAGLGGANDKLVFRDGAISSLDMREQLIENGADVSTTVLNTDWNATETSQSSGSEAPDSLSLSTDTGAEDDDNITSDGTVTVNGLIEGFRWQYSTDGGDTWKNGSSDDGTFELTSADKEDGTTYDVGEVQVRQINPFGVASGVVSNKVAITVDNKIADLEAFENQTDSYKYTANLGENGEGHVLQNDRAVLSGWYKISEDIAVGKYDLAKMTILGTDGAVHDLVLEITVSMNDANEKVVTIDRDDSITGQAIGEQSISAPLGEWFQAGLAKDDIDALGYAYIVSEDSATGGVSTGSGFVQQLANYSVSAVLSVSQMSTEINNIEVKNSAFLDNHTDWFSFVTINGFETNSDTVFGKSAEKTNPEGDDNLWGDGMVSHWTIQNGAGEVTTVLLADTEKVSDMETDNSFLANSKAAVEQAFTGKAAANATVTYTWNDGTNDHSFSAKADADGNYSVLVSFVDGNGDSSRGQKVLSVVQEDVAGNTSDPQLLYVFMDPNMLSAPRLASDVDTGIKGDQITKVLTPVISVGLPTGFDGTTQDVKLYRVIKGGTYTDGTLLTTTLSDGVLTHEAQSAWTGSADGTSYDVIAVYTNKSNGDVISKTKSTITIDSAASAPVITADSLPDEFLESIFDAEGNYVLTGTAEKGAQSVKLTFVDEDAETENQTFDAVVLEDGSWTAEIDKETLAKLSDGTVTITAAVVDAAGNTATSSDTEIALELANEAVTVRNDTALNGITVSVGTIGSTLNLFDFADTNGDGSTNTDDTVFIDGDSPNSSFGTLTYSATQQDGNVLPSWLSITEDGVLQVVAESKVPQLDNPLTITVTATDGGGATASKDITVETSNDFAVTSVLSTVERLDVRSDLVLTLGDANAAAATGGKITIRNMSNSSEKSGYHGESTAHDDIVLDVTGDNVTVASGKVFISLPHDLDLANNYSIIVSEGAFVNSGSGAKSAEVSSGQIEFSTVSPSNTGVGSVDVDAAGDIQSSAVWYDATSGDKNQFSQSLGSSEAIAVIGRDGDSSDGTEIDSADPSTYSFTGFGANDLIYIDTDYAGTANTYDTDTVTFTHDGSAPTSMQFSGDGGSVVVKVAFAGQDSDEVVNGFTTAEAGASSFESIIGNASPVISG